MAITIGERPDSRTFTGGDNPTRVDRYWLKGTADQSEVYAYVQLWISPFVVAVPSMVLYKQREVQIESQGHDLWNIEVPYGRYEKQVGSFRWDFDAMGGTQTVLRSKETVARYAAGDKDQFGGAINVRGPGGEPQGIDIVIPQLKLVYTFTHPASYVNEAHAKAIAARVGQYNSQRWRSFDAGEVLFIGSRGGQGTDQPCSVSYEFSASQNLTNTTIGGVNVTLKRGWDAAWIYAKPADVGGKPGQVVDSVFVERVYDSFDFSSFFGF